MVRWWIHTGVLLAWLLSALMPGGSALAQFPSTAQLASWNAQKADDLVFLLREQVDLQGGSARYQRQVAFAAAEALRRFPRAAQRRAWQWEQAYSLWMAGDNQACALYAGLLQQELSAQRVAPDHILEWFTQQEARLRFAITPLDANTGYRDAYLFELRGWNMPILYMFTQRGLGGSYRVRSLCEGRSLAPGRSVSSEYKLADLTADGRAEVILANYGGNGSRFDVFAYNLAFQTPIYLDVPIPSAFVNGRWRIQPPEGAQTRPTIKIEGTQFLSGGCSLEILEQYAWNGFQMQTIMAQADLSALQGRPVCAEALFSRSLNRLADGDFGVLDTVSTLINTWPVECARGQDNHPFSMAGCPADVRDEARYRVALSLAQAGSVILARQEMRAISDQPSVVNSRWVQPADDFARVFYMPQSLANACRVAGDCYPYLDLRRMLRQTSTAYRSLFFDILSAYDVPLLATGTTDIDLNRLEEHWFTVPQGGPNCGINCPSALWLVIQSNRRFYGNDLGVVDPQSPVAFNLLKPVDGLRVFEVSGQLNRPLVIVRDQVTGQVEITPLCEAFQTRLDEAEASLLRGVSPQQANRSLLAWASADLSTCQPGILYEQLPRLQYLQGLSFELLGDTNRAAASYEALVSEEGGSLFAFMAESKLSE